MATKKTRSFEIFDTIDATTGSGNSTTIDLNTFVNVAEMEAFLYENTP